MGLLCAVLRPDRSVFTVHDWKMTSSYDPREPAPEVFWNSMKPVDFSIGGRDETLASAFKAWLGGAIADYPMIRI